MKDKSQGYLIASGVIFGLVAILHLARAANGWAFEIGPMTLPVSVSWIAFVVAGSLSLWAIRLATSGRSVAS